MTMDTSSSLGEANTNLHDMARAAGRNLRRYVDRNWQGQDPLETMSAAVQEKPLSYALAALGIGVLIGLFVSRR